MLIMKTHKHPPALYVILFTEIWERFSYYGMVSILILYLVKSVQAGGLGVSHVEATHIYGTFISIIAISPLVGGFIADRYIGRRWGVQIGAFCLMVGEYSMFFLNNIHGIMISFAILTVGHAFFKPNIVALLSEFYENHDPRKDSAFSIFYMGVNIGAFFAPLLVGLISDNLFAVKQGGEIISYGYKYAFLMTATGMLFGQVVFAFFGKKYFGDKGLSPRRQKQTDVVIAPLTKIEIQRIISIFFLCIIVVTFWVGFEQAGSSINLYTDKYIDRNIKGFLIPTAWFQSLNPFFVVLLTPFFVWFWQTKGSKLSAPKKMGYGTILLGIGFLAMIGAAFNADAQGIVKASLLWVVILYFFSTVGELMLSPVGLSAVAKLSPKKFVAFMVAVWSISTGVSRYLSGVVAGYVEKFGAVEIFSYLAISSIVVGVLVIIVSPFVEKLMHGIK